MLFAWIYAFIGVIMTLLVLWHDISIEDEDFVVSYGDVAVGLVVGAAAWPFLLVIFFFNADFWSKPAVRGKKSKLK